MSAPPPPTYGAVQDPVTQQPQYPAQEEKGDIDNNGYPAEPPPKYEPPKGAPPGPGYPPGNYQSTYPQGQQSTVIIQNITFGPHPTTLQCPYCQAMVTTTVTYGAGAMAWLLSGLLCLFGCWLGCCLIPFCITDLQDAKHTCPNCYRRLGEYHRL